MSLCTFVTPSILVLDLKGVGIFWTPSTPSPARPSFTPEMKCSSLDDLLLKERNHIVGR